MAAISTSDIKNGITIKIDDALYTIIVSSSLYTGSYYLNSGSLGASGSIQAITSSQMGIQGLNALLVNFQTSTGSSGGGGGSSVVYTYVMTGYYVAGASRETWSGPSVNTPNPTGHPLVDIIVMGSYPPQNTAT
jgi:hypothetical protein